MVDELKKIDQDKANDIIQAAIAGQKRELYMLNYKVRVRKPRNANESVMALNWSPISRPIALTVEEYNYLTKGMAKDKETQSIITQLLLPAPGLIMSEVQVVKVKAK